MKKVLFVIPYLYGGGAEKVLSTVTTNFPKEYDIDILANSDSKIGYEYRGNIISLGMDRPENVMSVWFQFKVFLKRIKKLRKLKKTGEYLACYSFIDSANIANVISGNKKCKTIISVHTSLVSSNKIPQYKYIVNPLVSLLYNKASKIIAVSNGIKEELINQFNIKSDKIVAINNGCDIPLIKKLATESIDDDFVVNLAGKKTVVTVGRLTDAKGQWHLIRAFKRVHEKCPDSVLMIVGTGEHEQYLKNVAREAGVQDSVLFTGYQSNPYKFINISDVFVLSSIFEGFPCAMAEAMCVGAPCVATRFQTGSEELLGDGYGILSPICSGKKYAGKEVLEEAEIQLADSILSIINDPELSEHYKKKSIEKSKDLSVEEMINQWVELI